MVRITAKWFKGKRRHRRVLVLILLAGAIVLLFWFTDPPSSRIRWQYESSHYRDAKRRDQAVPLCENATFTSWHRFGQSFLVQCSIFAKPAENKQKQLKQQVRRQDEQILDQLRLAIGSAGQEDLRDPHLKVVKGDIHQRINKIVGADLVAGILVSNWHTSLYY